MQNGQQRANKQRRREAVGEASRGAGYERCTGTTGFGISGPTGDADGDKCLDDPGKKPGDRRSLSGGDGRGAQGSNAHGHATPSGNSGKRGGTLHGLADEAEIVAGMIVDGNGSGRSTTNGFGRSHGRRLESAPHLSSTLFHKVRYSTSVPFPQEDSQRAGHRENSIPCPVQSAGLCCFGLA